MYYGATFICGGVFILPVVCFCLTEQEKMQGQLATQFMPFSANRVYFNVLQQSNVETCWRCETSLSFVTRNLESQTEYLALSQALSLSQNTQSLKITKTFQKKANNICWEKSKPLGGGGLDGILNPSSPPPPNHPRTKELKRILVSSRVTNKVEIDYVSRTLSTFFTGMNFPNYLASSE